MSDQPQADEPIKFRRKGFKFLGLGLQEYIKYFFGGNASLAIIVLVLICTFLLKEGIAFFPDYNKELREYRQTGQEFVDYADRQIDAHTRINSDANIAYYAELNQSSKFEDDILSAYRSVGSFVRSATSSETDQLKRYTERIEDLEDNLAKLAEAPATDEIDGRAQIQQLAVELDDYQQRSEKLKGEILTHFRLHLANESIWENVRPGIHLSKESKELVLTAVLHKQPGVKEEYPEIKQLMADSSAKKKVATESLAEFKSTITALSKAVRPMKSFVRDLKDIASENAREAKKFSTAELRYDALLKGSEKAATESDKQRFIEQAGAVDRTKPNFEEITKPLIAKTDEHNKLSVELQKEIARLVPLLPKNPATESARENLQKVQGNAANFPNIAEESREEMMDWNFDKKNSVFHALGAFFFGKHWISNSSWRDFYGILPLFTGSLLIAVIALAVAVPFSLAAAIYVNQLASRREQNFIKPAIEFIGAIPSVVLGFFGILVLGTALRNISQIEALSWIPGFPMAERLTILNAGLLLAFMAVPTIFTLAEDALNNVPQALSENSFAMGASKLQTILRVVFPASISGIIAAVLLGFGRIVGETMVVLLVAGNKIKIPDFTEGIGVVTQPAHTMTGIIAQELGEVDKGSLHWGALFMVGLVLFFMSLVINFSAQRILKKLQKF